MPSFSSCSNVSAAVLATLVLLPVVAAAADIQTKCQTSKMKEAGKLESCLLKAYAAAAKKGAEPDTTQCTQKFAAAWNKVETKAAGDCVTIEDQASLQQNITTHAAEIASLLSAEAANPLDNTVDIEIEGVLNSTKVVMIDGPGVGFERIVGYDGDGNVQHTPGAPTHHAVVFDYSGPEQAALEQFYEDSINFGQRRAASIIVRDVFDAESYRYILYELLLTDITTLANGTKRYRLEHVKPPDLVPTNLFVDRLDIAWPQELSNNPATDTLVEIEGIGSAYVAVHEDRTARTLTLTFDYVEGGHLFEWVRGFGAGNPVKRAASVIRQENGMEVARRNFYELFPIRWEHLTGFSVDLKGKERVVLSYDLAEDV